MVGGSLPLVEPWGIGFPPGRKSGNRLIPERRASFHPSRESHIRLKQESPPPRVLGIEHDHSG